MAIKLTPADIAAVLDRALRDARDPSVEVDATWTERIRWLSDKIEGKDAGGKTYVAATAAALLAKAVNDQVDTLTQSTKAGSRGYGMRGVAEKMQERVLGVVHLGSTSKWPANNRPFLGGPARVDHFDNVAGYLQPIYRTYLDWMRDLDGYSADKAYSALLALMRVRMEVQAAEDLRRSETPRMAAARSTAQLVEVIQMWMTEESEHGARGQAVVAAVLGLVWEDVEVVPKHNPAPYDVMRPGKPLKLAVEVKQQQIIEAHVAELAKRTAKSGGSAAIYAALATDQPPLAVDRIRADAMRHHGVFLEVVHDARELVAKVAAYGGLDAIGVTTRLPQAVIDRCGPAGVGNAGADRLADLLRGIEQAQPAGES